MKHVVLLAVSTLASIAAPSTATAGLETQVPGKWFVAQFEMVLGSGSTYREDGKGMGYVFHADGSYDGCIERGSRWDAVAKRSATPTGDWTCTTDKSGRWSLRSGVLTLRAPTLREPILYVVVVDGRNMTWTQSNGTAKTRLRLARQ